MSSLETQAVLRCHGAVGTVTGSMHMVEANGDQVLLDCGLFQGRRAESRKRNRKFPFDPKKVTTVVLSHAHIDHCGNLPQLVREGFRGQIVCTPATRDLAEILLEDSAHIQQKDAAYYNKKAKKKGWSDRIAPLYALEDVWETIDRMRTVPYGHATEVGRGMRVTFRDAGHIIGSSSVGMSIDLANGTTRRLTFTGDVGRKLMPILRDPDPLDAADLILSESTYGDRVHPEAADMKNELAQIIERTANEGGKVVVPAFSVGRTQNLVYFLHELFLANKLPRIPIFVDSPLSSKTTMVYRAHPQCYDRETHSQFLENEHDPFGFADLKFVTSTEASKALNVLAEPCVIIASSGMCEAGRILHHLRHNISDPRSAVVIVGYQAQHTLGRRLVDRVPEIKIYGEVHKLKANVVTMGGLSAHADSVGLVDCFAQLNADPGQRALLVHGEENQSRALATKLADIGVDAKLPTAGKPYII